MDRRAQLKELFYVDFPDELFEVWEWHQHLEGEPRRAFHGVMGVRLHGPFDVLAGSFDGKELRYPAVLHWRYQYDPPELFTVMTGNVDGLHWGYWFDDPGRLPPVVASFYARDAFELVEAPSLFRAIAKHLAAHHAGTLENKASDRKHADAYDRDLAALDALLVTLPKLPPPAKRMPTVRTGEGMGIVAEGATTWTRPKEVDRTAILEEAERVSPGTALVMGRKLWDGHKALAFEVLDHAYARLGRDTLRRVASEHRAHPALPSLDILKYKRGDYSDLTEALANPRDVRELENHTLAMLPDTIGECSELEVMSLGGGKLTALPASLALCTKLRRINIYNNRFTQLPPVLLELPHLAELVLGKNQLTALDGIGALGDLEELDVSSNPIARLPDDFCALKKLRSLNLAGTKLAELPDQFCDLEQLEFLALQGTAITRMPTEIAKLHKLKRLALPKVSPEELDRIRAALPATTIA